VDPVCFAALSVPVEMLSDVGGGDWDPLQAVITAIVKKEEKILANRFIFIIFFEQKPIMGSSSNK
jgi:hypothetical protein